MYRGSCSCQAIQYEIDHIGELDADDETLTHSDTSELRVTIEKEQLVIDCAPSALGNYTKLMTKPTTCVTFVGTLSLLSVALIKCRLR